AEGGDSVVEIKFSADTHDIRRPATAPVIGNKMFGPGNAIIEHEIAGIPVGKVGRRFGADTGTGAKDKIIGAVLDDGRRVVDEGLALQVHGRCEAITGEAGRRNRKQGDEDANPERSEAFGFWHSRHFNFSATSIPSLIASLTGRSAWARFSAPS